MDLAVGSVDDSSQRLWTSTGPFSSFTSLTKSPETQTVNECLISVNWLLCQLFLATALIKWSVISFESGLTSTLFTSIITCTYVFGVEWLCLMQTSMYS
jgi:hypothetical protein